MLKNLVLLQPGALVKRLFPGSVWNMPRDKKVIYLTFDDGPVASLTSWVLDELRTYQAKATFFCVGENVQKQPALFHRISEEGHLAGNHTMHHLKGFKHSVASYINDVDQCDKLVSTPIFRPPYGQLKRSQFRALRSRGYQVVLWDVISYDYEKISPEQCFRNVLSNTRSGSIVLFHDNPKAEQNLRYALPLFLKHFTAEGFEFRSLNEILV